MNDLQICKRIAEIFLGVAHQGESDNCIYYKADMYEEFNPLTDDALCFQLSKKYNVCIMHYEEYSTARIWDDPEDNPIADFSNINNDTSLNKAICLAIIEAHKD